MTKLEIGFSLYASFDSLDAPGPLQTFSYAGFECRSLAENCEPVEALDGVSIAPGGFDGFGGENCADGDRMIVRGMDLSLCSRLRRLPGSQEKANSF
jgi:hypothetical protein